MRLNFTSTHRADLVAHQHEKFCCPLLFPNETGKVCPIAEALRNRRLHQHDRRRGLARDCATR